MGCNHYMAIFLKRLHDKQEVQHGKCCRQQQQPQSASQLDKCIKLARCLLHVACCTLHIAHVSATHTHTQTAARSKQPVFLV